MTDDAARDGSELAAGDFSAWLTDIQATLRGEHGADVPCGTCTACCTASQFIHIAPDEADTLAHIPPALLFPAPGLPRGHVVLGYDERGHCPMLLDGACSIYAHRPRTCRAYDCRVFPAAGLEPQTGQEGVARQARRWRFGLPRPADVARLGAVRATAAFLDAERAALPAGIVPSNPTQLAAVAIRLHEVFLRVDPATGEPIAATPDPVDVRAAVLRRLSEPPDDPAA